MPEILRLFGYTFFFFSREHEPVHVHIEGADGYDVYDLKAGHFVQRFSKNIKLGDLRKIEMVLEENKDAMVRAWNNYFNNNRI